MTLLLGFDAAMTRFAAERLTVIVLANNGFVSTTDIAKDLAAMALGIPVESPEPRKVVTVDPTILRRYVGRSRCLRE